MIDMKKIKWIQLRPDDVLNDIDFRIMTAKQRGVFWTVLLLLYCNGGKIEYNPQNLKKLCNCRDFENIWEKISKKFSTRNGVIKHKRVTKELKKVKKFLQDKKKAGLKGAKKRWHCQSDTNGTTEANEKERDEIEEEKIYNSNSKDSNTNSPPFSSSISVRKELLFNQALKSIIPPKTQSDRSCFNNITRWLYERILDGHFSDEVFSVVLDYAKEAAAARGNHAAIFVSIVKKELGYEAVKSAKVVNR